MENKKNKEYTKVYYEHFAKLTLEYFGYDINNFIDGVGIENPDLQNEKEQIGIEVTSAFFKKMRNVICYRENYINSGMSTHNIRKCLKHKEYEKYAIFINTEFKGLALPLHYANEVITKICEKITEKIQKKKNYIHFKVMGLYISIDEYASKLRLENIRDLWEKIKQIEGYKEFDYYYINSHDYLFRIDVNSEKIDDIEITIPDWKKMNKQALLFERNEYNKARNK